MSLLESHYPDALKSVQASMSVVAGRKVVDVKPTNALCRLRYPCGGHGSAIFTFDDGSTESYECSSVCIGALEAYYLPERMAPGYAGNKHFLAYITEDFAKELWTLRGG